MIWAPLDVLPLFSISIRLEAMMRIIRTVVKEGNNADNF